MKWLENLDKAEDNDKILELCTRPEKTWEKVWQKYDWDEFSKWDYESELVYSLLVREFNRYTDQLCLEGGCGTGRISFKLAQSGAHAILLDTSKTAVEFSKKSQKETNSYFVVGSIFRLPFRSSSLDFVWNAGVLEHFQFKEQQAAISEFLRVLKSGRKLIVVVPNKKAYFYNLFRILSMKMKTWPFGYEEPLSRKEFEKFSPKPSEFLSCGLLWQLTFCVYVRLFSRGLTIILKKLLGASFLAKIDKTCPGYLIAGIFHK